MYNIITKDGTMCCYIVNKTRAVFGEWVGVWKTLGTEVLVGVRSRVRLRLYLVILTHPWIRGGVPPQCWFSQGGHLTGPRVLGKLLN